MFCLKVLTEGCFWRDFQESPCILKMFLKEIYKARSLSRPGLKMGDEGERK